jgi:hypothetical protein
MTHTFRTPALRAPILAWLCIITLACSDNATTFATSPAPVLKLNPCSASGTVQLAIAATTRIDCTNGGTTVTLAAQGASYLVVPEFATNQANMQLVPYRMFTGTAAATASAQQSRAALPGALAASIRAASGDPLAFLKPGGPGLAQQAADRLMRARARQLAGASHVMASRAMAPGVRAAILPPPALGSVRSFHVNSTPISSNTQTWATVSARLAYAGTNILLYIDTLAPANGFTPAQLQSFGTLFDQTLYSIGAGAFGAPADVDQNGHVIMLMSPVVNAASPASQCASQGYVAGFFDPTDFDGPSDPNSNQGEVFYAIVPDPTGAVSCPHLVSQLGDALGATFLHELQHLVNYSQHVVIGRGASGSDWVDEGMSIVAEELGSVYYEQKCPPPACRTSASQLFPDSSQGYVSSMLYDSYSYALLPDTASLTLHYDSDNGFAWRGGDWLLMRWLGDQFGSGLYQKLERGPADGVADIEQATGQSFPSLFANFGLALYTDSLSGLPRNTAPAANRFVSRNVRQLWARLYATSGGSSQFPLANPVQLFPVTTDSATAVMYPGTMTFFRLDTPATAATTSIQFSAPGGAAFPSGLRAQMAIFRLPPGQ